MRRVHIEHRGELIRPLYRVFGGLPIARTLRGCKMTSPFGRRVFYTNRNQGDGEQGCLVFETTAIGKKEVEVDNCG